MMGLDGEWIRLRLEADVDPMGRSFVHLRFSTGLLSSWIQPIPWRVSAGMSCVWRSAKFEFESKDVHEASIDSASRSFLIPIKESRSNAPYGGPFVEVPRLQRSFDSAPFQGPPHSFIHPDADGRWSSIGF